MHPHGRAALVYLVVFVLLTGLLAGCGGDGSQDSAEKKPGDGTPKKAAPQKKIALGKVKAVVPDRRRLVLRQANQVDGAKKLAFNVRKTAEIDLDGKKVEMDGIKEGQQAQVKYVVTKNEVNAALTVHVFETGGQQPSGEGEKTG